MKRVLIFSDSRWRDSFGDTLLALKLKERGLWVKVISYDLWNVAVPNFKPHLVLLNHLHGRRNNTIANMVKRNGGIVAVLPTEGRPNTDDIAKWFFSQLNNDMLDVLFSWNELEDPNDKVIVTGHPRFEIYSRYKHLIESRESFRERYGLSADKEVIGITTSFPQAKFANYRQAVNEHDWKDLGMSEIPGRENATEFAIKERRALKRFQSQILIMRYRSEIEREFILKPHPMSELNMWARFCYDNNIKLCSQEYIFDFLNGVDRLFARENCMTIIEGFLSEKEVTVMPDDGYLDKIVWNSSDVEYFLGTSNYITDTSPSSLIADHILEITRSVNVHEDPSPEQITMLEVNIRKHDSELIYPNNFDPHLGKSVVHSVVQDWAVRIGDVK